MSYYSLYIKTMKIGSINIKNGIFLAPMEDVSDYPFRMICKRGGADVVYSEFISSEALIRDAEKAVKKMFIHPDERPIGIQIFGNRADTMVRAAQIAEEKDPDFIDINFGCPVKKVALKGAGAGLLQDIPAMISICQAVVKHTTLPVTAKTRLGWDANSIVICDVAKQMEDAGIEAIAVHARTRAQGYKGEADWSWIRKVKESVKIPVIGNGDVISPQQVKDMFDFTGCDAVMIGRGAIQMPWIFNQAKFLLTTGKLPPEPALKYKIELLLEHLHLSVAHNGEHRAMLEIRKFYSSYLKGLPNIAKFRMELMQHHQMAPVLEKLMGLFDQVPH
jgi:tRNA-dihydrouridine synthase B